MLGLDVPEIDPTSLISAILKAQVDLIWFGGIGTYVKAASENHVEVGDPANDRLRVNAEESAPRRSARAPISASPRPRASRSPAHGGRINTDFIDNSAGVDCSDNEVNIKIALNREMIEGRLASRTATASSRDDRRRRASRAGG
jgi:glutamate dehydrogenase